MRQPRQRFSMALRWLLVTSALLLTVGLVVWLLLSSGWLAGRTEQWIMRAATRQGVELDRMDLHRVGLAHAEVGLVAGSFEALGRQTFSIDRVVADYRLRGLWEDGRVDAVSVVAPQITLTLPYSPLGWLAAPPAAQVAAVAPDPAAPQGEVAAGPVDRPVAPAEDPDAPVVPGAAASADEAVDPFALLADLPFASLSTVDGTLLLDIRGSKSGASLLGVEWDVQLDASMDERFGVVQLATYGAVAEVSARVDVARRDWSATLDANLQPAGFAALQQHINAELSVAAPVDIRLQQPLKVEALLQGSEVTADALSLLVGLDALQMHADVFPVPLRVTDALAVVRWSAGEWMADGGLRLHDLGYDSWRFEPFAVQAKYLANGSVRFGSEAFRVNGPEMTIDGSITGSVPRLLPLQQSRMLADVYIQDVATEVFRLDAPTSMQLSWSTADGRFTAAMEAAGLQRRGLLQLRGMQLRGQYDGTSMDLDGDLQLETPLDGELGQVRFAVQSEGSALAVTGDWQAAHGGSSGHATLRRVGSTIRRATLKGELPSTMLSSLWQWWSGVGLLLSGSPASVDAVFDRSGLLPRGHLRFNVDGASAHLPGSFSASGLHSHVHLSLLGLPRGVGEQTVAMEQLELGDLQMENVDLKARWPLLHRLEVTAASAAIEPAGTIRALPFSINPFLPNSGVTLALDGIAAQNILDWLEEDRFAIAGDIKGQIQLWIGNDGVDLTGLELRLAGQQGHFTFRDRAFVANQFASLGNLPMGLKERLLNALLDRGIALTDFTVTMAADAQPEQFQVVMRLSGETIADDLSIPIGGLTVRNVMRKAEVLELLGLEQWLRIEPSGGSEASF